MPRQHSTADFSKILARDDLEVNFGLKSPADRDEKTQRLRKEMAGHYVKDIGIYVVCYVVVRSMVICCFWTIFRTSSSAAEKENAWAILKTVLAGALGILFGKGMK